MGGRVVCAMEICEKEVKGLARGGKEERKVGSRNEEGRDDEDCEIGTRGGEMR